MATIVRDAIDRLEDGSEAHTWARFQSAVGTFHGGGGDVSDRHDDALVAGYSD